MKKGVKITLWIACACIVLGLAAAAVALLGGASWRTIYDGVLGGRTVFYSVVPGDLLELNSDYEPDGRYTAQVAGANSLRIWWPSGEVTVSVYDGAEIAFEETSQEEITEKTALRWGVQDGVFIIQACQAAHNHNVALPEKDLEVRVPRAMADALQTFAFSGASADLHVMDIKADEVEISTSSGPVWVENVAFQESSVETASGEITLAGTFETAHLKTASGDISVANAEGTAALDLVSVSGTVDVAGCYRTLRLDVISGDVTGADLQAESLDIDGNSGAYRLSGAFAAIDASTVSGNVELQMTSCPDELEIQTVSGCVELALPEDSSFTLETETVSGDLKCAFPAINDGGDRYVVGNGENAFRIETTSSDITLKIYK